MNEATTPVAVLGRPAAAPAMPGPEPRERRPLAGRVLGVLPTALIFAALGGIFAWGHSTGWAVPTFASLTGQKAEAADDWCPEHSVPESICVECDEKLLPRPKEHGWCKEHGVHECPLCHPEVAQLNKAPSIDPAARDRAAKAIAFADRPVNSQRCTLQHRRLQFVSAEAADKAGIEVEPVWTGPMTESVRGPGEVVYDPTRMARLSPRSPGSVFRAFKQIGDRVTAGEVVALIDAADVGKAKSDFLQSLVQVRLLTKTVERLRQLEASGSGSAQRRMEAEAALSEAGIKLTTARQSLTNLGLPVEKDRFAAVPDDELADKLRFLGLPAKIAASLDPATTSGNLLPVVAPLNGIVTLRDVVAGEVVDVAKVLYVVADPSELWMTLDLRLEDAASVAIGHTVRFRPDGAKSEVAGTVSWLGTEIDHRTRTVKARATLSNPDGKLKANTFGTGTVILREEPKAVVVPTSAVHWEGCCHVVFVRDRDFLKEGSPKVFHIRKVRIGAKNDTQTEIIAGLLPGEVIVTAGGDLLRTELLRNNLGEGCGHCHPH
jgi:cobalt-zinc-cadmium efflux system membrane fusion protein